MAMYDRLKSWLNEFLSCVFPSRCVACGSPVSMSAHDACPACLASIIPPADGCPRCGGMLVDEKCLVCGDRAFYPDRNICAGEYRGALEAILKSYKFDSRARLHRPLSVLACRALEGAGIGFDLITAVPMSPKKRWKRGFNQSELVARALAGVLGTGYRRVLKERRGARRQREMRRTDRFINVLDRYAAVDRRIIRGARILIVDDILTTGATINECARTLKNAGAAGVYSLTLARAGIKKLENLYF
jgi:competence protein ComFC